MHALEDLLRLPCGCWTESGRILVHQTSFDELFAECPWCPAVFEVFALRSWLMNVETRLFLQAPPRTLVRYGDKVFEARGLCGCGSTLVCEPGDKHNIHLDDLPPSTIEVARN